MSPNWWILPQLVPPSAREQLALVGAGGAVLQRSARQSKCGSRYFTTTAAAAYRISPALWQDPLQGTPCVMVNAGE